MIITKGKTVYIGGRKFGPGSDCPENLLDEKLKDKLKNKSAVVAQRKISDKN